MYLTVAATANIKFGDFAHCWLPDAYPTPKGTQQAQVAKSGQSDSWHEIHTQLRISQYVQDTDRDRRVLRDRGCAYFYCVDRRRGEAGWVRGNNAVTCPGLQPNISTCGGITQPPNKSGLLDKHQQTQTPFRLVYLAGDAETGA